MRAKDLFSAKTPVGVVYRSNTPNGLQFVRSLGQAGVPVLALSDGGKLGRMYSRYAYPLRCPDGLRDEDAFIRSLVQIGQMLEQKAALYLMNDPHLIIAGVHREVLDKYYEIPLPSWKVIERCLDKAEMGDVASQAGIPMPMTFAPTSEEELETLFGQVPYPCILKPISRYEYRDGALRQKAFQHSYGVKALRANNEEQLLEHFRRTMADDFRVIVQEEIPGSEDMLYTVGLYADRQSELKGTFTGRKLHQLPPDFGLCTYGESLHEPLLLDMAAKMVKAFGFHGIAQIEFKLDDRDGQFKLMEINPRGWQWSYLATACGVNLPYLAFCDLYGLPLPKSQQTMTRMTWTHIADEGKRFWNFARKGKSCPETSWRAWLGWLVRTLLAKENQDAVLSRRDPVPAMMMFLRSIALSLSRIWRNHPPNKKKAAQ